MKPPESLEIIHQVLRQHPVRRIILEWNPLQIDPHRPDQTTSRDVSWHNARWTWAILREIPGGRARHLYSSHSGKLWRTHLSLWLQNFVNLGRGCNQSGSVDAAQPIVNDLGPVGDGYWPRGPQLWKSSADFQKAVEQFQQGRAAIEWLDDPLFAQLVTEVSEDCARHGTQLYLVITPTLDPVPLPPPGIPLLMFNDPAKYPGLFSVNHRTDWEHLDENGALEFSRELARAYAALLGNQR
jgi:hypothetical protein